MRELQRLVGMMSPRQMVSILDSEARINVWHGAIRSGKTFASLVAFLMAVAVAPPAGLIIIAGRTLDTIGRNVLEPMTDDGVFGRLISKHVKWTSGSTVCKIFGRTVHLIGANDRQAEGKLRGSTVCLAYIDEATLLPYDFFRQMLGRMSVKGARMFATTNPDNPAHWLRKEYINRQGELNLRHWKFGIDDNPSLDPDYVRDLKAEYTGLWYKRFILGNWVQSEGAVYEMWDEDRMVVDVLPMMVKWLAVGIDYGTTNPFSALTLGLGADKRLYLVREWRWDSKLKKRQLTDVEYSKQVRQFLADHPVPGSALKGVRPDWWVLDPSAASFRIQLYEDGVTARLANNEVKSGINTVGSLLTTDRLKVHRSCEGFIDEIPGYSWDEKASGKGNDEPIKADDHSLDAGRYAIFTTRPVWNGLLRPAKLTEELEQAA
ncbi:terminase large subunit [Streptomyces phage Galactica]|nr:terminase large subunit [Streptomyces phage Galactica]